MATKHIYYKNDFACEIAFKNTQGEPITVPTWDWSIEFTDGYRKHICSIAKGNAEVKEDGKSVVCYLDNHKFGCGQIRFMFKEAIPNTHYLDGFENLMMPSSLDIELWNKPSDGSDIATGEIVPTYVIYDAWMIAKANGYTGTQSEFYTALNNLPSATQYAQSIANELQYKMDTDYWRGDKGDKGDKGDRGDDGAKGEQGERGEQGIQGIKGADGVDGIDGFSPVVETSKVGKVTTINITDKNGTHTATINDGEDGKGSEIDAYTKAETDVLLANKADDKVTYYDLDKQEQKEGTVAEGVLANSLGVFALGSYIEQMVVQEQGNATDKVMSQKAVTDLIGNVEQLLANI